MKRHHLLCLGFLCARLTACGPEERSESNMQMMPSMDMAMDSGSGEDASSEQDADLPEEDSAPDLDMPVEPESVMLTWPLDPGRHILDVAHDGSTREVRVVVPEKEPEGVLLLLHGSGQTAESFSQKRAELISLAMKSSLLVIIPLAEVQGTRTSWNYAMLDGAAKDVDFLREIIMDMRRLEIRGPRYVAGFSNGGRMTHTLLSLYPRMFTAGGVVASNLGVRDTPEGIDRVVPETTGAVPIWMANGSMDPSIPFDGGPSAAGNVASVQEAIDKWVAANQCQGEGMRTDFEPEGAGYSLSWDNCMGGTRVMMTSYRSSVHEWPEPGDVVGWDANLKLMQFFSSFMPL